ncbi:MAG: ABC transporter ATP-binding protein [Peptococcaceae bacterium]|nr:ABC transporter ATP-binding protein [Peptococcaceae bacterium]
MALLSVDVRHMGKSYGERSRGIEGREVLRDISFTCDRGAFVSLVGASGCGKTTLLRCLAGLEDVSEGEIWVEGFPVCGADYTRAVVFQEPRLFPWLTVGNNVALGLRGHKPRKTRGEIRDLVAEKLDFIGLADYTKAYPRSLSGGMAQRVALARALAFQAPVMLLDEPFSSLDIRTRGKLQEEVLLLWRRTGKTILWVTHDIGEAVMFSQRILVLGGSVAPTTREPSRILRELEVDLPYPRDPDGSEFIQLRKEISAEIRGSD